MSYSQLFREEPIAPRATLRFEAARTLCARFDPDGTLTLGDDRGRLLVLDLAAGVVRHDLRLRP